MDEKLVTETCTKCGEDVWWPAGMPNPIHDTCVSPRDVKAERDAALQEVEGQKKLVLNLQDCYAAKVEEVERLKGSVQWYQERMDALQEAQSRMREPERTVVCDLLANGALLPDPQGKRYGLPDTEAEAKALREAVNAQADDEALWFQPLSVGEDMLQRALRRLHALIEGDAVIVAELAHGGEAHVDDSDISGKHVDGGEKGGEG